MFLKELQQTDEQDFVEGVGFEVVLQQLFGQVDVSEVFD